MRGTPSQLLSAPGLCAPVVMASAAAMHGQEAHDDVIQSGCALKNQCQDDVRVWRNICVNHFSSVTTVDQWVGCSSTPTYRQLYPVLSSYANYVGVWHTAASSSPSGALYSFRWAPNGIDIVQLLPARLFLTDIRHEKLCTLGPCNPRYSGDLVDGTKCVLRDYGRDCAAGAPAVCPVAEAAACVAAGGASSSRSVLAGDAPLGSSPPGSSGFAAELLRFMQSSVQKTRSGRRNRRSGGSGSSAPILHHFCRVPHPLRPSSRQHPHQLRGLWKGLYGPHGCELLAVSYDFSERSAHIVATKLTGDPNVPAGEVTWRVAAAPLPLPWPAYEQQLLALRPALVSQAAGTARHMAEAEAVDEAAGNGIIAVMQQEEPVEQGMQLLSHQQQQQQQPQAAGGKVERWEACMQARRVASVYQGKGRVAGHGFKNPSWVDGRLWVYDDGSCGFVFMLEAEPHLQPLCHLIDLQRLDGDL